MTSSGTAQATTYSASSRVLGYPFCEKEETFLPASEVTNSSSLPRTRTTLVFGALQSDLGVRCPTEFVAPLGLPRGIDQKVRQTWSVGPINGCTKESFATAATNDFAMPNRASRKVNRGLSYLGGRGFQPRWTLIFSRPPERNR